MRFSFATLACISSLAAAPKLPTWRLSPAEYVRHQRERHIVSGRSSLPLTREDDILTAAFDQNAHKLHIRKAQKRSRLLLCIALLLQVSTHILLRIGCCQHFVLGRVSVGLGHHLVRVSLVQPTGVQQRHETRLILIPFRHRQDQ